MEKQPRDESKYRYEAPLRLLIDLPPRTAYWRGVIAGVVAYCRHHPDVRYGLPPDGEALTAGSQPVDGIVAIVPDEAARRRIERLGKPVVNVSSIGFDSSLASVVTDNRAIGALAADHLLAQGYVAFAFHMESRVRYSGERLEGFRARLREAGRGVEVFDSSTERGAPADPAALREATAAWLRGLRKPVGVMAHNDARAAGILAVCRDARLRVPEEVGVIGVDDDAFLDDSCFPTLSSIDNAPSVVGYRAAEMLVAMIGGAPPPPTVLVVPRGLVQRHSTQTVVGDDPLLLQAVRTIRLRAFERIGVGELLQEVPFSRRSLERSFRLRLGRSPAEEVLRVRMDRAKSLLVDTDLPIGTVGESVGYGQGRNFATAFRREVGMEPRAYRATYGFRGVP